MFPSTLLHTAVCDMHVHSLTSNFFSCFVFCLFTRVLPIIADACLPSSARFRYGYSMNICPSNLLTSSLKSASLPPMYLLFPAFPFPQLPLWILYECLTSWLRISDACGDALDRVRTWVYLPGLCSLVSLRAKPLRLIK